MKNVHLFTGLSTIYIICFISSPIIQNEAYHNFADQRQLMCCNNTMDVLSNLAFILVGLWGLYRLYSGKFCRELKTYLCVFFAGTVLVGFGSAYYHLEPNSSTLVWDRLPMTIAFMSLVSFIIHIFKMEEEAKILFPWLIFAGLSSVVYWDISGDLKAYLFVQFLPILWLPWKLSREKTAYNPYLWLLLLFYLIAKVTETADKQIFEWTQSTVSGHTLKHIFAALAVSMVVLLIKKIPKA